MIDDRDITIRPFLNVSPGAVHLYDVPQHVRLDFAVDQLSKLPAAIGRDRVVRVHPEQPVASRMPQGLIPGGGKVVAPREMEQSRAELFGDPRGLVLRSGVDDHNFVNPRADAGQARTQGSG